MIGVAMAMARFATAVARERYFIATTQNDNGFSRTLSTGELTMWKADCARLSNVSKARKRWLVSRLNTINSLGGKTIRISD